MKFLKTILLLAFLAISGYRLFCFDQLFQLKLDIQEKYPPQPGWTRLDINKSFVLEQSEPNSFIKMGVCLHLHDGKLIVLDNNLHKLLVFDMNGRFLGKYGIPGKGPGDIDFPSWFEYDRDELYIANNNGIDIFDKDFKFIKRIRPFVISSRFCILKNRIYSSVPGAYQGRYPLCLGIAMDGGIETELSHADFSGTIFKYSHGGSIVAVDGQLMFFPTHKNMVYRFETNGRFLNRQKIDYPLLDDVEKWNERETGKNKEQSVMVWFCNIFASAKAYKGNIYLLLQMPRLEILCLDQAGQIRAHYYNSSDFRFMRWYDFAIHEKDGKPVFFLLGFSDSDEEEVNTDFNVFKMEPSAN